MNKLSFLITLLTFTASIFSMEEPPRITEQKSPEGNGPLITLENLNDHIPHKIPKSHLVLSTTLKQMLEDAEADTFAIPDQIAHSFDLIEPYFELAFQESNQREEGDRKIRFIKNKLIHHSDEELIQIALAFNYLNMPLVTDQAHDLLAERFSNPEKLAALLQKESKELQTSPDCKRIIAQGILARKPEIRRYWLAKTYVPQEIQTSFAQLQFPVACFRAHAINSDGTQMATAFKTNTSIYLASSTLGYQTALEGHILAPRSLDFSHDNTQLVSSSKDHTIRIWSLPAGTLLKTITTDYYRNVCFNRDGSLIASTDKNDVCFWDSKTGVSVKNILKFNALIHSICFNHDSTQIAVATGGHGIHLANVGTGDRTSITRVDNRVVQPSPGTLGVLTGISFNPDSSLLATIDNHDDIYVFDPNTHAQVAHFPCHVRTPHNTFLGNALRFTNPAIVSALTHGKIKQFQMADPTIQKWFSSQVQPNQVALLAHIMKQATNINPFYPYYEYYPHIPLPAQLDTIARPAEIRWGLGHLANRPVLATVGVGLAAVIGYKTL